MADQFTSTKSFGVGKYQDEEKPEPNDSGDSQTVEDDDEATSGPA